MDRYNRFADQYDKKVKTEGLSKFQQHLYESLDCDKLRDTVFGSNHAIYYELGKQNRHTY